MIIYIYKKLTYLYISYGPRSKSSNRQCQRMDSFRQRNKNFAGSNERKTANRKKEITTGILVNIMKVNDIDCFDITDGQLIYSKKNLKKPLSKKHLLNCISYFSLKMIIKQ